jgi:hypothetical protein
MYSLSYFPIHPAFSFRPSPIDTRKKRGSRGLLADAEGTTRW